MLDIKKEQLDLEYKMLDVRESGVELPCRGDYDEYGNTSEFDSELYDSRVDRLDECDDGSDTVQNCWTRMAYVLEM